MLRKTMIVLATAAALTGGLTAGCGEMSEVEFTHRGSDAETRTPMRGTFATGCETA
jgi:hypothetical protein